MQKNMLGLLLSQLYGHICVFLLCVRIHECVSKCAAPAQSSDSLHGDRGTQIWHLRAQTMAKKSGKLSVGSSGKEADC